MTTEQKKLGATRALCFFALAIIAFGVVETYRHFYFKNGEPVTGVVQSVDRVGTTKSRRWRAEITTTVGDQKITRWFPVPRGTSRISLGATGSSVNGTSVKVNDELDLLAVPKKDGYALALADDVLHLGREYTWLSVSLAIVLIVLYAVRRKPNAIKKDSPKFR